jgi:hypothetical protein
MTDAPKLGTCYCGCGRSTGGHFARGDDAAAASMLRHMLNGDRIPIADLVAAAGFGPGRRNLRQEAEAAGWRPTTA